MAPPHPDLLAALRLRRWALDVLTGQARPAPDASGGAWTLFLQREACATRLRDLLGVNAPPQVRAAADRDLQQILLLRAELDAVLAIAGQIEVTPIVLKGGAVLHLDGRALWAKDLDLLLPPAEAGALVRALDAAGWRAESSGTAQHFGERARPGLPPVEVHPAAGEFAGMAERAAPHPTLRGARLLHPDDQVRHVLIHQAVTHPSHRGRLRDLVLLSTALGAVPTPPEIGALRVRPQPAGPIRDVLAMAVAMVRRERAQDRFSLEAAMWYEMDRRAGGRRASSFRRAAAIWTFAFAAGNGATADLWHRTWGKRIENAGWGRGLGGTLRIVARALWLPPLLAWSWANARALRRAAMPALAALEERVEGG